MIIPSEFKPVSFTHSFSKMKNSVFVRRKPDVFSRSQSQLISSSEASGASGEGVGVVVVFAGGSLIWPSVRPRYSWLLCSLSPAASLLPLPPAPPEQDGWQEEQQEDQGAAHQSQRQQQATTTMAIIPVHLTRGLAHPHLVHRQ